MSWLKYVPLAITVISLIVTVVFLILTEINLRKIEKLRKDSR